MSALRAEGVRVDTGRFSALMEVELVNDGPVTIVSTFESMPRPTVDRECRGASSRTSGRGTVLPHSRQA